MRPRTGDSSRGEFFCSPSTACWWAVFRFTEGHDMAVVDRERVLETFSEFGAEDLIEVIRGLLTLLAKKLGK